MQAFLIGLSSGLVTILIVSLFRRIDKHVLYGLILACIGFLYIGYTWMDVTAFIVSCIQALFFLSLAYLGIKKSSYFLIIGYFLHGVWDLIYGRLSYASLIPPHYDFFCMMYDVVIAIYLWILKHQAKPLV